MSSKTRGSSLVANVFLTCMSLVYLSAFCSIYTQIPGLYGEAGILPVHRLVGDNNDYIPSLSQCKQTYNSLSQDFESLDSFSIFKLFTSHVPNEIFCLIHYLQISPIYFYELICLIGIGLSIATIVSNVLRHYATFVMYFLLWFCYYNIYKLGQQFTSFQWDILLLETGFLSIFVPIVYTRHYHTCLNTIIFFLIRWLLFRLMFASGIFLFRVVLFSFDCFFFFCVVSSVCCTVFYMLHFFLFALFQ